MARSGKEAAWLPPPPLRTAPKGHPAPFNASGSSISNAPSPGTQQFTCEIRVVELSMAVWMKQHEVLHLITPAKDSPKNVMTMPSSLFGDRFMAHGTKTFLQHVQGQKFRLTWQLVGHSPIPTLLKVRFSLWVIGIGCADDLDVASYRNPRRVIMAPERPILMAWIRLISNSK